MKNSLSSVCQDGVWISMAVAMVCAIAIPNRAQAQAQAPSQSVLQIGAAVSAIIEKIYVRDNDHVDAGQVLIKFDCRPLEEEARARAGNFAAASAVFERVKNGPRPDEVAIGVANVGVALARADEARAAYGRETALREGVTTTVAAVLQAQRDARISAAQLDDAKKKLDLLHAGSRIEDIQEAQALRDAASALADEAQARLDQCTVRAPAAGTVKVLATVGQFVSTSVPVTLIRITVPSVTQ